MSFASIVLLTVALLAAWLLFLGVTTHPIVPLAIMALATLAAFLSGRRNK